MFSDSAGLTSVDRACGSCDPGVPSAEMGRGEAVCTARVLIWQRESK